MERLRLNKSALELRADQAYFQDQLFDGIAYTTSEDEVIGIESYHEGRSTGPYQDPYFDVPEDTLRVLTDSLTPYHEDLLEPYTYHGQPYKGLAFQFEQDYCTSQSYLEDGRTRQAMEWDEEGTLVNYEHYRVLFQESAACYPNGQLKQLKLNMKDHFSLELDLSPGQSLEAFTLRGDYFERAPELASEFFFFPLPSIDTLSSWQAAPRLFLSGSSVNDAVFQRIQDQGGFQLLQKLSLFATGISGAEIQKLAQYKKLFEVKIDSQQGLLDTLKQLKAQRPDIKIRYLKENLE